MSVEKITAEVEQLKEEFNAAQDAANKCELQARDHRAVMSQIKQDIQSKLKELNDARILSATERALTAATEAKVSAEAARAEAESSKKEAELIRNNANALHESLGKREAEIEEQLNRIKKAADELEAKTKE